MRQKEKIQDKKIYQARPLGSSRPVARKRSKAGRATVKSRWMYLIGVSERLSELNRGEHPDSDMILKEIEANLNSLSEVFTRDIDPVSDLEGYAVRRISQEFATLVKSVRFSRK